MTEPEIREALRSLYANELGLGATLPDGPLAEKLDSVARFQLVVAIEDHFELCFEPEDEAAITTVDDLVAIIHTKLSATP